MSRPARRRRRAQRLRQVQHHRRRALGARRDARHARCAANRCRTCIFNGSAQRKPGRPRERRAGLRQQPRARPPGSGRSTPRSRSSACCSATAIRRTTSTTPRSAAATCTTSSSAPGLGPRAYAIIEQGMISRVIEAKPEELRVFLEEAAGVSKYKERRARDRAPPRRHPREPRARRRHPARARDAAREARPPGRDRTPVSRRCRREAAHRAEPALVAAQAGRRERGAARRARDRPRGATSWRPKPRSCARSSAGSSSARVDHYAAGDAVNAAQGALYEVNTEVSRLEAELRFMSETRHAARGERGQLAAQLEQWQRNRGELDEAAGMWQRRHAEAAERIAAAQTHLAEAEAHTPEIEQAHRAAQDGLAGAARCDRAGGAGVPAGQAQVAHAGQTLDGLRCARGAARCRAGTTRRTRLGAARAARARHRERRKPTRPRVPRASGSCSTICRCSKRHARAALARLQELEREANTRAGRLRDARADPGAGRGRQRDRRLAGAARPARLPRLWQKITVEPGWETAIESVLRERLHALQLADPQRAARLFDDPPPARVSLFTPSTARPAQARSRRRSGRSPRSCASPTTLPAR